MQPATRTSERRLENLVSKSQLRLLILFLVVHLQDHTCNAGSRPVWVHVAW